MDALTNGKKLIDQALCHKTTKTNAFWIGHPTDEAKKIYHKKMGLLFPELPEKDKEKQKNSATLTVAVSDFESIDFDMKIGSDMSWVTPELDATSWQHPDNKPIWDCFTSGRHTLGTAGVFAECESVEEVEKFDWPNPNYLDFSNIVKTTKYAYENNMAVFGGMWSPFFHIVCDFFGMENYFCKMHTDPEVVHAVTRHVVDFLLEANRRCLDVTKDYLSAAFFGNDLGSQLNLMISPDCFDEFILPYIKEIIEVIKRRDLKVAMHSCGAIDLIIPKLIDAGVDILHPLQAKAAHMDAENLSKKYAGKIVFMGGVDTQDLLPFGTPEQVRAEVLRLRDVFKNDFIVSPSHEALLANVPYENVIAMSKAAKE